MKTESTILFFTIGLFSLGFTLNFAYAEITPNNAFLLEGTGFGVNEELIQFSEIDFAFSTGDQSGSRADLVVEDGFVNIGDDDFIVADITGTVLRDGKFLRISGVVENLVGGEATISYFGRLIEDSKEGSIYSFTGRINLEDESYKIVYTSKISPLIVLTTKTSTTEPSEPSVNEIVIHIKEGAHNVSGLSYIDVGQPTSTGSYTMDRISIEPGTTITWINDDTVSHSIISGSGLDTSKASIKICDGTGVEIGGPGESFFPEGSEFRDCDFITNGIISSGEILPNESWSVEITERGFYRLIDPDYPYMTSVIYAFPQTDSLIIGTPGETFN